MKNLVKYGKWAGAVTAIIVALVTINQYRFWASATALMLVANTAYSAEGKLLSQRWTDIDFLIRKCKADPKCEDMKVLEQMKADVAKKIEEKEAELKAIKDKE